MVEVGVQGKASASFGILGSNSDTKESSCRLRFSTDVKTRLDEPEPQLKKVQCPECGSSGPFNHAGTRQTAEGLTLQRYYCKDCNLRFSEPNPYKLSRTNTNANQVCVEISKENSKNLEPQQKTDVVAISRNQKPNSNSRRNRRFHVVS